MVQTFAQGYMQSNGTPADSRDSRPTSMSVRRQRLLHKQSGMWTRPDQGALVGLGLGFTIDLKRVLHARDQTGR